MINCIIIDDEPLAIDLLELFCKKIPYLNLKQSFTDVLNASAYIQKSNVDLVFLDINMPELNGIEFSKKYCQNKMTIFTTAYSSFAILGFEQSAIDFILKPLDFNRFLSAVEKAAKQFNFIRTSDKEKEDYIIVNSKYKKIKLFVSEILYLEASDDYLIINSQFNLPLKIKSSLTTFISKLNATKLPGVKFFKIHRSFAVALKHVTIVKTNEVFISNFSLPFSDLYKKEFLKYFNP